MTTVGFSSKQLLDEEQILTLPSLSNNDAIEIGQIAVTLGRQRKLPIAIEVRIGEWIVFHASLEGSKPENDWWINRKVAVVVLNQHSTMFERVSAEERVSPSSTRAGSRSSSSRRRAPDNAAGDRSESMRKMRGVGLGAWKRKP